MTLREFWRVNDTSRVIFQSATVTVAETGRWLDIYLNGVHYTGTLDLARATAIFIEFSR